MAETRPKHELMLSVIHYKIYLMTILGGFNAVIFSALYFFVSAAVHARVYYSVKPYLLKVGRLPENLALGITTTSAIDISSILQFIIWIPFGFGKFNLSAFYLFLIPTLHEIHDLVYLLVIHRRRFTIRQIHFVMQHHTISLVGRTLFAGFVYSSVPAPQYPFYLGISLLMYCCSIFLIAPSALEPLFFGSRYTRGRALFRTVCFLLARLSHFGVFGGFVFHGVATPGTGRTVLLLVSGLICALNEAHSVVNGLPRVREVWKKMDRVMDREVLTAT